VASVRLCVCGGVSNISARSGGLPIIKPEPTLSSTPRLSNPSKDPVSAAVIICRFPVKANRRSQHCVGLVMWRRRQSTTAICLLGSDVEEPYWQPYWHANAQR